MSLMIFIAIFVVITIALTVVAVSYVHGYNLMPRNEAVHPISEVPTEMPSPLQKDLYDA